ncbi:YlxM family DNA-binding protein [Alkaliphilus peptidifermentans]|uniref:UPF0122 protein SAMN03080606_02720 n=1 Tax=Alkaliphilus peptidifermentans DSM 18978 TaxID=1120976 RepID=A0A1G5J8V0_9FIRM|nr:putative DNA-binding protein [Alkaliphilus peptidifermentans]SCY84775.1 hypothetical protein SAMN03080606_02720 [Alkaliphilus peptidifermentans DSM 18978]
MIEKTIEITMLYDFYSQLLTERQRDMIDYYYNQDFSLSEIAEVFNISRQAVYDTIKRTEKILYEYEEKLKLIQLFTDKTENVEKALQKIIGLDNLINTGASKEVLRQETNIIKELLTDMLN